MFAGARTAVLAAISHGTNYPAGQDAVKGLVEQTVIKAAGSESVTDIQLGHVDVQQPDPESVLSGYAEGEPAVLVPLLLSAGFHVNVDLRKAAEAAGAGRPVVVAGALGPDARLVDALEQRLSESGADPATDVFILGAAGSSNAGAVQDVKTTADMLAERLGCPVQDSYLSFAQPTVHDAVSAARAANPDKRVVIASYLLAPGYFQNMMTRQGADISTGPLLDVVGGNADVPPGLPDIVLDRFHQGLARL